MLHHVFLKVKTSQFRFNPRLVSGYTEALVFGWRNRFCVRQKVSFGDGLDSEPLIVLKGEALSDVAGHRWPLSYTWLRSTGSMRASEETRLCW